MERQMDIPTLLLQTLSPIKQVREDAETQLRAARDNISYIPALLSLLQTPQVAKQAAVQIKHNVIRCIEKMDGEMKKQVVGEMVKSENVNMVTLDAIAKVAEKEEFRELLLQLAIGQLQTKATLHTTIPVIYVIMGVYKWKANKDRLVFINIIKEHILPQLAAIANEILQHFESHRQNSQSATILKRIIRIYYDLMVCDLPHFLREDSQLALWGQICLGVISLHIKPSDDEEEWIKTKKWAYRSINKLFNRYGNPATSVWKDGQWKNFGKHFAKHYAPQILGVYLQQTSLLASKDHASSEKIMYSLSEFYSDCLKNKTTWNILKPNLPALVDQFVFPIMCFSEEDQELWDADPVDYVQKKQDVMEEYSSVQSSVSSLLVAMSTARFKTVFPIVLQFIQTKLTQYEQSAKSREDAIHKDGALAMIAAIAEVTLTDKSNVKQLMQSFLVQNVFPEINSPYPFMRERACALFYAFSSLDLDQEASALAWQFVCQGLKDPELPVKCQAAMSLEIVTKYEMIAPIVEAQVGSLLQYLLDLTAKIELDSLSMTMDHLIESFPRSVAPFAHELVSKMCESFYRIISDSNLEATVDTNDSGEETIEFGGDDSKLYTAMGIMKTISSIIDSMESSPAVLQLIEPDVIKLIVHIIQNSIHGLYEDCYEISETLTGTLKSISENQWQVFTLLYNVLQADFMESFIDMAECLENYIKYGADFLSNTTNVRHMMCDLLIQTVGEQSVEQNGKYEAERHGTRACKLMTDMLLLGNPSMFDIIPNLLQAVLDRLRSSFKPIKASFKGSSKSMSRNTPSPSNTACILSRPFLGSLLGVIMVCLYKSTKDTIAWLHSTGSLASVLRTLAEYDNSITRVRDRKLCILGCLEVAKINIDQLPMVDILPQVLKTLTHAFDGLDAAITELSESKAMYESDEEYDGSAGTEEEILEDGEDGQSVVDDGEILSADEDENEEYNNTIELGENKEGDKRDLMSESDGSETSSISFAGGGFHEEVFWVSPVDDVNVYAVCREVFGSYQTQFPQNHQYLTSLFSTESGASLAQSLDKILRHQDDPSAVQVISNAPSA